MANLSDLSQRLYGQGVVPAPAPSFDIANGGFNGKLASLGISPTGQTGNYNIGGKSYQLQYLPGTGGYSGESGQEVQGGENLYRLTDASNLDKGGYVFDSTGNFKYWNPNTQIGGVGDMAMQFATYSGLILGGLGAAGLLGEGAAAAGAGASEAGAASTAAAEGATTAGANGALGTGTYDAGLGNITDAGIQGSPLTAGGGVADAPLPMNPGGWQEATGGPTPGSLGAPTAAAGASSGATAGASSGVDWNAVQQGYLAGTLLTGLLARPQMPDMGGGGGTQQPAGSLQSSGTAGGSASGTAVGGVAGSQPGVANTLLTTYEDDRRGAAYSTLLGG